MTGRNDYFENWTFAEVFQISAILALSFNLLHDKEIDFKLHG